MGPTETLRARVLDLIRRTGVEDASDLVDGLERVFQDALAAEERREVEANIQRRTREQEERRLHRMPPAPGAEYRQNRPAPLVTPLTGPGTMPMSAGAEQRAARRRRER